MIEPVMLARVYGFTTAQWTVIGKGSSRQFGMSIWQKHSSAYVLYGQFYSPLRVNFRLRQVLRGEKRWWPHSICNRCGDFSLQK